MVYTDAPWPGADTVPPYGDGYPPSPPGPPREGDGGGHQAPPPPPPPGPRFVAPRVTLQAWAKPLASGAVGVVVLNRATHTQTLNLTWGMLGLNAGAAMAVRDLWAHAEIGGVHGGVIAVEVAPHDVRALLLRNATRGAVGG